MSAMAASLFIESPLAVVEVIQAAGEWHRRARLGAFGWWSPEACRRGDAPITATRKDPPGGGAMCGACWPVWPGTKS